MGIFDFVKKGAQELFIARPDEAKGLMVYKHPDPTVPNKAQITVGQDECALFYKDGVFIGRLDAGAHKLETGNIPFLNRLVDTFTGGNLYRAELWFISLREVGGWRFGGRIGDVEDPKSGLAIQLMVHGEFSIQVEDVQKLIAFFGQRSWSAMCAVIVAQLLFLESENPEKDVFMYINSPGGVVTAGLSVYDTMQYIKPKVATLCIGQACSMGSLLLTAGEAGMRYATPNARIMIHQPSGGFRGQASDIEIHAQEIISLRRRLNDMYVKHTGQKLPIIEKSMDRDNFMSADESKKFGLIDEVVANRGEAEKIKKK